MGKDTIARRLFAAFSRYRPRALTLAVLAAIAVLLWLANLSGELAPRSLAAPWLKSADVLEEEASKRPAVIGDWLRGLAALRKAKPELAIDVDSEWGERSEDRLAPKCEAVGDEAMAATVREAVRVWKEQQAAK